MQTFHLDLPLQGVSDATSILLPRCCRSCAGGGELLAAVELAEPDTSAPATEATTSKKGAELDLVFPNSYLPGRSPAMTHLYGQLQRLARGSMPVLICGETGVGKECIARIVHASSRRRMGPFVAINCAAIPADLLEAELFGVGKAVATGVESRPGTFLLADGGTLFLDEVGEMSPALQAKLLRALQEHEIQPVGGRPRKVDVRILAATNADLHRQIEANQFRRDLYYRLAGVVVEVPPLRHCREDLPPLIEQFLRTFTAEAGIYVRGLSVKALRLLTEYSWPGNVRELEHEVRRMAYLAQNGQILDSGLLSPSIRATATPTLPANGLPPPIAATPALEAQLATVEARLIRDALAHTSGNQSQAARRLGLSRNGLLKKMKRLGITG